MNIYRRMIPATTVAIVLAIGAAGAGCTVESGSSKDGVDVLNVAASAAITTWDPVQSYSTEALYLANVYEPLLWKNPPGESEEFRPGIAESWAASENGLTWTFKIRQGATFHDGEPVDAEAVKASIEAAVDRGTASFIWAPLEKIEASDDHTVVMHLNNPAALDTIAASTYGAWIVSPKALEASANDKQYFADGIDGGSGPYAIKDYVPGERVVLERYDEYWDTANAGGYEIVNVAITPDVITAQQMLTSGEVDYAAELPFENVESVAEQVNGEVVASEAPFNYVGFFNTTRPPLDDPKVRQALSYAAPYDDLIEVGSEGYGSQSRGPVPQGLFPYSESVPQYHQDLNKARQLLQEAGHGDGFSLNLTYSAEDQAEARFVPLIKDAFAKIGVELNVRAQLFNQQWENAKSDPKNAQDIFFALYWPTYSDGGVDNLYALFHSSDEPFFNLSYWKNDEYDRLVREGIALTYTDPDNAQATYEEAMTLLVGEAPALFLYDVQHVHVVPDALTGIEFNPNYPFTTFFAPIRPATDL